MTNWKVRSSAAWVECAALTAAHEGGGTGGVQTAVALTPADGEFLTSGVQSNWDDNGWATRNGFTRAANWGGLMPDGVGYFAGWDDVNFIPVSIWAADFAQTSGNYDKVDDVAVNGFFPASGAVDLDMALARGKWVTVPHDDWPGGTIPSDEDACVIGVITGEEPGSVAIYDEIAADAVTWLASSDGAGRFHQMNYADNLMNGDLADTYFPDDMVLMGDYIQCDQYWCSGASISLSQDKLHSRLYYDAFWTIGGATQAQTYRGSHYGSMMDSIRKAYPGPGSVGPFAVWIEAAAPYSEAETLPMPANILKWAVWATLVHGARGIQYFVHNFRTGDTWGSPPWDDHFGDSDTAGTGIYAAMKEINERAVALAQVINSPLDGYFVYGDTWTGGLIETEGFLTDVTSTNARDRFTGVDASCRWHPVEQKHYILATTREVDGSTNWPVTFRMVDQDQTEAYELHEDETITIERGGAIPEGFCEFSDTFATAASYKAYRID